MLSEQEEAGLWFALQRGRDFQGFSPEERDLIVRNVSGVRALDLAYQTVIQGMMNIDIRDGEIYFVPIRKPEPLANGEERGLSQ